MSDTMPSTSSVPANDRAGTLGELLQVATPLVISTGTMSVMHAIDRIFLAQWNGNAFAAALPAGIMFWTVSSVAFGIALYTNTFVAQYHGKGESSRLCASVWQGVFFSFIAGILLAFCYPFSSMLFQWIGHEKSIQPFEADYFGIMCLGATFKLISVVFSCYYTGQGKTVVVMGVNVASMFVNFVLDYLLIFGIQGSALGLEEFGFGVPEFGMAGAAWATVIANLFAMIVYLILIVQGTKKDHVPFWNAAKFDRELMKRMIRFGTPHGLQMLVDISAFAFFIMVIGQISTLALKASSIAFTLNSFAFIPMSGIGTAVMVIVGQRIGERRPQLAVKTTYLAFTLAAIYMGLWCSGYLLIPRQIMAPFLDPKDVTETAELISLTIQLLWFVSVYAMFDAMAIIFGSAVRGAGDTRFALHLMLFCGIGIFILPMLIVWMFFEGNIWFYWGAVTFYIVVLGVGFLWRFLGGKWKQMSVIDLEADALSLSIEPVPLGESPHSSPPPELYKETGEEG